ncbi:MAG: DUF4124 domain-containing protein [Gammaproteobacteria bacterium]|nr:DUF4124 domain-containing protein [Gammaproteobacteria bacterium]NIQ18911.1 DUF4124 domain-containing protein [Gammaproteobacteria bacterium]NIQ74810.1 DUF4124 domain-containing protein [Gammaproteobacteria bacterium]NIT04960.1 DUF4124 domain-containing protein [Gammaproteobacteria bacterium]NIT40333.1 DUF4124 domain-containing protein [Gammaproteobacteria bacterium]
MIVTLTEIHYSGTMRILLLSLLFLAGQAVAEVYRSVDEDGNITYSDKPTEGAEKIKKQDVQTIDTPNIPQFKYTPSREQAAEKPAVYNSIAITSPENNTAVRENAGNVTVNVSIKPDLKTAYGHSLSLTMDGKEVGAGRSRTFSLSNIDRGTHTLVARVKGSNGQVIIESDPVTITVLRYSNQNPPRYPPRDRNLPPPPPPPPTPTTP